MFIPRGVHWLLGGEFSSIQLDGEQRDDEEVMMMMSDYDDVSIRHA